MKYFFVFLVVNIILFGVVVYLADNLPLFSEKSLEAIQGGFGIKDEEEFQTFFNEMKGKGLLLEVVDIQNFEIMLIVVSSYLFTLITTIHLLIDKLFYKSIIQLPNLPYAIRRALLVTILFVILLILRLYAIYEWYYVLFGLILIAFIEYTIYHTDKRNIEQFTEIITKE